eukprot:gb/GECG01006722.1/.p1 GENE.gb/GECG01006722.1/~~gb/GECG01006722.1/.p1  ORF type:complete len:831 (+),score=111.62 gb/GECG01006722.1/:1-2493(+)
MSKSGAHGHSSSMAPVRPFASTEDVLECFPKAHESLQLPGRRFITSEYVEGAKTPDFSIPRQKTRRRPYYFVLFSDVLLIGKRMNNVLAGKYRCYSFPLLKSKVKMANQLEDGFFPIHLICTGNVGTMGENDSSKDGKSTYHFTLWCETAEQRERMIEACSSAQRTLNARLAEKRRPKPVKANLPVTQASHSGSVASKTGANQKSQPAAAPPPPSQEETTQDRYSLPPPPPEPESPPNMNQTKQVSDNGEISRDSEEGAHTASPTAEKSSSIRASDESGDSQTSSKRSESFSQPKRQSIKSKVFESPLKLDVWKLPSVPEQWEDHGDPNDLHRYRAYCEIVDTEKQYVRDLQTLIQQFKYPLKRTVDQGRPVLKNEDIEGIFSNAETLLEINGELLQTLCKGISDPETRLSDSIAHAFTSLMPFFRMYTEYCQNYWNAMDIVRRESESNQAFSGFLQYCARQPEINGLGFESFLIKPVQRICKYPLFFKDLLKHMGSDHPCRDQLEKAANEVGRVANEVNTQIDREEKTRRMVEIRTLLQESIPDLLQPGRHFVLDKSEVYISFPNGDAKSQKPRPFRFFLFTDSFIIAKHVYGNVQSKNPSGPNGPRYKVVSNVDLTQILLRPGYGQELKPDEIEKSKTVTRRKLHEIHSAANSERPQSAQVPATNSGEETPNAERRSTSLARYGSSSMSSGNPGAGMGEGGSDLYLFDLLHKRPVRHKDGSVSIAIDNITFWFKTMEERDSMFQTLKETAETWIEKNEDLQRRRETQGVSYTGKKREFHKRKAGGFSDFDQLRSHLDSLGKNKKSEGSEASASTGNTKSQKDQEPSAA